NETWDNVDFAAAFIGDNAYKEFEAPPCEYDGLSTDLYRVRTFSCQPFAFTRIMFVIIRDLSENLKEFCEFKTTIRAETEALECIRGEYVNEYKGKMNYTWDGKTCDNWADAPLDKAINTTVHKIFDPDSQLNYCRNIGGEKKRPWCWVDNFQSVGYCPLAFCNEICHLKEEYSEYQGKQSFSTSGKHCREWSDGNEEGRKFLADTFSGGVQAGPYCRNPGYSQFRAWCYVDGQGSTIIAEPCDVPHCPTDFLKMTVRNNETNKLPLYLHQCYHSIDSFNVQHYFDLTIQESTIINLCRNFEDKLLFCFTGGDWTRVEFECFDVSSETTIITEASSPSSKTTFLIEETFVEDSLSMEISSLYEVSMTVSECSPGEASSSVIVEDLHPTSYTVQNTPSLNPSFSLHSGDTISITSDLSTSVADTLSNTPVTFSTSMKVTQTMDAASSSYKSMGNTSSSNITCGCFCINVDLLNSSEPVVKARVQSLTRELEMDYKKLSATVRKRMSAEDDRPSVTYLFTSFSSQ
ncbi:hypothetical protein LOTGIDRAFT_176254, partial [Lottia gigantea]